ncbi:ABC transporter permease subunit [Thalassiella azotivora]
MSPTSRDPSVAPPAEPLHSRGRSSTVTVVLVKVAVVAVLATACLALTPVLLAAEQWLGLAALWGGTLLVLAVYSTRRLVPLKYLLPGTLLLTAFIVYPIALTVQLSFTNFGDGHRGTKDEAVASIVGSSVTQLPDSRAFTLTVGTTGSPTEGPFTFFLVDQDTGDAFSGDAEGLEPLDGGDVTVADDRVTEVPGFTLLTPRQVNEAGAAIQDLAVPTDDGAIRPLGTNRAFEGVTALRYDEAADEIVDTATGTRYPVGVVGDSEFFVDGSGRPAFSQSWLQGVGTSNYERILTNETIREGFLRIGAWTLVFALLSVGVSFAFGLGLAIALDDARIRGQRLYRSVLVLPYGVPTVVALLVWSNFYNRDFGLINELTGLDVNWLGDPTLAKAAVVITNVWMTVPYFFVVSTGALQAIPSDVREAAAMDGASGWQTFRQVVLPLLLVAVAPLLVASFAFAFNNFNAIQLLTEGGPFPPDNPQAGHTDILISYVMRLAFGGSGAQLGFAAAASVLLFVITAVIATIQFRSTRVLEEVS